MRKKGKKKYYGIILATLLLLVELGYSYFHTDLNINGDALMKKATWNIEWVSPPTVSAGSVSGANVTTAAHVTGTNNDIVEYSITLTNPRDYYEFTVTAENTGEIDGMISTFSNKVYRGNSEIYLPDYVKSEVTYSNGTPVKTKQVLAANSSETFKVKVSFRDDIETSQLPTSDTTLSFKFNVTYVQADNSQSTGPGFNNNTPWEDVIDGIQDGTITPAVGDTKTVDMGTFGTHTLRVANTTTPAECGAEGFSQTACGLVLEFADIITEYNMNPSGEYQGITYDYGWNVGGWPASSMRTYVNSDIYNALPTALKNAIINTRVISGHGSASGEANFTSTDKLYLLSTKEVWGKKGKTYVINNDTAEAETRQLDYYAGKNVRTSRYSEAIKEYNGFVHYWGLRSAVSNSTYNFYEVETDGSYGSISAYASYGVSPAFRIA